VGTALRWALFAGVVVIIALYVFTDNLVALWLFVALELVGLTMGSCGCENETGSEPPSFAPNPS
jgi:hypothetical protein